MRINKPKFWDYKRPNFFSFLLLPFTIIIKLNIFFQTIKKTLKKNNSNHKIKTICVGNIYVGGTGKTPSSIKINQILDQINLNSVFIKKNYPKTIDELKLLENYGKVISNSNRIDSLNISNKEYDVAIFDDGLQDASINYDLKIVCFNINNFVGNGFLIPAGPLREKLNSIKKYDAIFLNGNSENSDEIKSKIKRYNKDISIFESSYSLLKGENFDNKINYVAFAGIGIPLNFYKTLIKDNINVVKFLEFPDHYIYTEDDIKNIKDIAKSLNAKIITTEKDFSRLENSKNVLLKENIQCIKMELKIKNESDLINFIKKKL